MTTAHPVQSNADTQCAAILDRLKCAAGEFVPMPELVDCSGSYVVATRVSDLRQRGHTIENKIERRDGKACSSYRLVAPAELHFGDPDNAHAGGSCT